MNIGAIKGVLIKITIVLITLCVLYSVFWFFKIGQMEKQINRFVSDNATNVSIGSFEISGYPFGQNIEIENLRFSLPTTALNKYQIIIPKLKAKATIFDSKFDIKIIGTALAQNRKEQKYNIVFNSDPRITVSINDGFLLNFNYQDSGHKVFDTNQNLIYSANSANVNITSHSNENGVISLKINSTVGQISNFGIFDIYKNAFEDKLINAINTGQIALNDEPEVQEITEIAANTVEEKIEEKPAEISNSKQVEAVATPEKVENIVESTKNPSEITQEIVNNETTQTPEIAQPQEETASLENKNEITENKKDIDVKTNVTLAMQYVLTPNQSASNGQIPLNVAQMQESSIQYSKVLKIDNLNISNQLYKIDINGTINIFSDDTIPSGSISLRLEKFLDIINYVDGKIKEIAGITLETPQKNQEQEVPNLENKAEVANVEETPAQEVQVEVKLPETNSNNAYHEFLSKISVSLAKVSKEIAEKNPTSSGEIAQYDIRREKNLEFLVNETSIREILGKF